VLIKLNKPAAITTKPISLRCPACRNIGSFHGIDDIHDIRESNTYLGQRVCPNNDCNHQVFVVFDYYGNVHKSYPPQRIDFDSKAIPPRLVSTFNEALACHSESLYVAAAIMIRRTLEELCEDKAATGKDLKARLGALQSSVLLPPSLFTALDDLRLLGNDAAHIEAKTYDSIGEDEVAVGIELTKEILKAVYQLDDLLSRLRALKK